MESFWPVFFICMVITYTSRVLPFLVFRKGELPGPFAYLGTVLPLAIMGLLVVYALRVIRPFTFPHGFPELFASACVVFIHVRKRNMMVSILGGTLIYMVLIQFIH